MLMLRNDNGEATFSAPPPADEAPKVSLEDADRTLEAIKLNGTRSSEALPQGSLYVGGPPTPKLGSSRSDSASLSERLARSEDRADMLEDKVSMLKEQIRRLQMERDALALDNERLRRVASASPTAYGAAGLLTGGGSLLPRGVAFENMSSTNV